MEELIDFPSDILKAYQEQLSITHARSEGHVDEETLAAWSGHFALFTDLPSAAVRKRLLGLSEVYRSGNTRNILAELEGFDELPGCPFVSTFSFVDHINYLCHFYNQASSRKIPKVPIVSIQKSASSYINVILCKLFEVNPSTLSFFHIHGMRPWIKSHAKYGGVIHDHFYPSLRNISLLHQAGIKKCIVHHRNPVEVLISLAHHAVQERSRASVPKDLFSDFPAIKSGVYNYIDQNMEEIFRYHAAWLRAWRSQAIKGQLEILETRYEDMKNNERRFFESILDFSDASYGRGALDETLEAIGAGGEVSYNFRKAESREWEKLLTPSQILRMHKILRMEFPGEKYELT